MEAAWGIAKCPEGGGGGGIVSQITRACGWETSLNIVSDFFANKDDLFCQSLLQCPAVSCSLLYCPIESCSALQCHTVSYSVLNCPTVSYSVLQSPTTVSLSVLQCRTVQCSVLQYLTVSYTMPTAKLLESVQLWKLLSMYWAVSRYPCLDKCLHGFPRKEPKNVDTCGFDCSLHLGLKARVL